MFYSRITLIAVSLLAAIMAPAHAGPPRLNLVIPPCARAGEETTWQLVGEEFSANAKLILPFPADVRQTSASMGAATFVVRPAAGTPPGVYPLRVRTAAGISNLRLVAVTDLPIVQGREPNNRASDAQQINIPTIVGGELDHPATDVETFRFTATAGERLTLVTETRRIGLTPDLMLNLCDASGRLLATADATPSLRVDARIDYTFARSGEYLLKLHDADFNNIAWTNLYLLKIGPFNYARTVFPLGGRRGQPLRVTVLDRDGHASTIDAHVPDDPWVDDWSLPLTAFPGALPWPMAAGDLPEMFEDGEQPGQADATATRPAQLVAWPATINGRIRRAGEEDLYRITVTPGQEIRAQVDAYYQGSLLDGHLLAYDPAGKQLLAQSHDSDGRGKIDPALGFRVPDGVREVVLALRDTFGHGGLEYGYRLTIEPGGPDFYLSLGKETFRPLNDKTRLCDADDTLNLPIGREVKLPITVRRSKEDSPHYHGPVQGYRGPITLRAIEAPPGVTVQPAVVPAEMNDGALVVTASADAPREPFEIVIVGEATRDDGTKLRHVAERRLFLAEPAFTNMPWNHVVRKVTCVTIEP